MEKRPQWTDPFEYALYKEMYFDTQTRDIELDEIIDRAESRSRNTQSTR